MDPLIYWINIWKKLLNEVSLSLKRMSQSIECVASTCTFYGFFKWEKMIIIMINIIIINTTTTSLRCSIQSNSIQVIQLQFKILFSNKKTDQLTNRNTNNRLTDQPTKNLTKNIFKELSPEKYQVYEVYTKIMKRTKTKLFCGLKSIEVRLFKCN